LGDVPPPAAGAAEPPLRADAATNRRSLLEAAARLYAERGLEVPYEEIAREAGVGRATIYRHFPTRELLLSGILDAMVDALAQVAAELPDDGDAFFALFEAAMRMQRDNLTLVELATTTPRPLAHSLRARARLEDLFRAPLAGAQRAGRVRDDLETADIYVLLVMLSALTRESVAIDGWTRARRLAEVALRAPDPR
jgi:AcrR family transcriptional regulator